MLRHVPTVRTSKPTIHCDLELDALGVPQYQHALTSARSVFHHNQPTISDGAPIGYPFSHYGRWTPRIRRRARATSKFVFAFRWIRRASVGYLTTKTSRPAGPI